MAKHNQKSLVKQRIIKVIVSTLISLAVVGLFVFGTKGRNIPLLNPKGEIANQEYDLLILTVGIGLCVIIPVFIMLFSIAWRYREGNKKAKYDPTFNDHKGFEALWWGIPIVIIIALSIITAITTHKLDPYRPLESTAKPVNVQVVAMQWKWLFIYPDEGVATVNYLNIPEDRPINLKITSDAPMNSFWIPSLTGQIYAMSGMTTKLHFMADEPGEYVSASTNITGKGYADMYFKTYSMPNSEYQSWVERSLESNQALDKDSYQELLDQKDKSDRKLYVLKDKSLYDMIVHKYMDKNAASEGNLNE